MLHFYFFTFHFKRNILDKVLHNNLFVLVIGFII